MINYIFGVFLIFGIVYSFLSGKTDLVNQALISSGSDAIDMIIKIVPLLC